jgi:hypothetical protein
MIRESSNASPAVQDVIHVLGTLLTVQAASATHSEHSRETPVLATPATSILETQFARPAVVSLSDVWYAVHLQFVLAVIPPSI